MKKEVNIKNLFFSEFNIDDVGGIWRKVHNDRYALLLEHGYLEYITEKDIDITLGRDLNNLRRQVTPSMVRDKIYVRVTDLGKTVLEFYAL